MEVDERQEEFVIPEEDLDDLAEEVVYLIYKQQEGPNGRPLRESMRQQVKTQIK